MSRRNHRRPSRTRAERERDAYERMHGRAKGSAGGRPRRSRPDGRPPSRGRTGKSVLWLLLLLVIAVAVGWGLASGTFEEGGGTAETPTATDGVVTQLLIPEGLRREDVAELLAKETDLDPQAYLKATGRGPLGAQLAGRDAATSLEGFLFPATYDITETTTVGDLVNTQVEAYKAHTDGVNFRPAARKNFTEYEVVTIASLIEREVRVPNERRKVASVIYNRLRENIPLQIDATVLYALGSWDIELTNDNLDVNSPYNTRRFPGIPPGPIASPGEASIRAAANPAQTDFIFYVARNDGTGRHFFSSTQEQFERDVERSRTNLSG